MSICNHRVHLVYTHARTHIHTLSASQVLQLCGICVSVCGNASTRRTARAQSWRRAGRWAQRDPFGRAGGDPGRLTRSRAQSGSRWERAERISGSSTGWSTRMKDGKKASAYKLFSVHRCGGQPHVLHGDNRPSSDLRCSRESFTFFFLCLDAADRGLWRMLP